MTEEQTRKLFHDLKNDFAAMTALLNLHKIYKNTLDSEELLSRLTERQLVISTAYEALYQEDNFPNINMPSFVSEVLQREHRTLGNYCSWIDIKKDIADIDIPLKHAMPFTQIIVELVSNSYRHAFAGKHENKLITIAITGTANKMKLEYTDNGTGFPAEFDPDKSRTLGMQFIRSFAKQLGSKVLFGIPEVDTGMSCTFEC